MNFVETSQNNITTWPTEYISQWNSLTLLFTYCFIQDKIFKTVHMVDFLGLIKYFRTMLVFKRPLDVRPDPVWTRTRSVTFCQVWQILWIKYYIRYYLKPRCMKQVLQYQYCHICFSFLPPTVLNVMIYRQLITLCHYFIALLIDSLWFYELFIYTWQIHHRYNHSSDIYVFNACM